MFDTSFTRQAKVAYPIICGPMYPCSNPELVAAVSEAGGLGIIQPLSLAYVYGYDLRAGIKYIQSLTSKPFGMNIIVEKSSKAYEQRMQDYVDIALEEGCRFFITSLGSPQWVVEKVKPFGGLVYHDVTSVAWAEKALKYAIDGFICVNNRAGGHAGTHSAQELYDALHGYGLPLVCAGGIGGREDFQAAMKIGYAAVQMGTRFIASKECREKDNYKQAIVNANEQDIVLTERVTGVPLSVIRTPYVDKIGTKIGPIARLLFKYPLTKRWMRMWYGVLALRKFKKISLEGGTSKDYWQAGKSVAHIHSIKTVAEIIQELISG